MVYDPGALRSALAAAVGDDPELVAELRAAFLESVQGSADLLARSRSDGNWKMAARRLQSVAASFGAVELMGLAEEAAEGAPHDPALLRQVRAAIAAFDG
ncbi:MAG: Hpt protein [Sphingomonas bacterium]|nr:Hpt protein [Sphingomonas bacterium]